MVNKMKWWALALAAFSLAGTACAPTPVADRLDVCWLVIDGQIIALPPGSRNASTICAPVSTWRPGLPFPESADQPGNGTPGGRPGPGAGDSAAVGPGSANASSNGETSSTGTEDASASAPGEHSSAAPGGASARM